MKQALNAWHYSVGFCFCLKKTDRLLIVFTRKKMNQLCWTSVSRSFTSAQWGLLRHFSQSLGFNPIEIMAIVQKSCFVKTLSACFTVYSSSNLCFLCFLFPTMCFNKQETKLQTDCLWFIFLSSCSLEYTVCENPQNLFSNIGLLCIIKDGLSQ